MSESEREPSDVRTERSLSSGRLPSFSSPHDLRGRRLGRFLVLGLLGSGGMGVVVEAHDDTLDRNVALKLLDPFLARYSERRLLREAQALARLSHPNIVQIYDVGELEGQTFIAMELVRGHTLRRWARERPKWRTAVRGDLQAARGLAAAHAKGLVHRDFKPENCIIDHEGRVRVLDFGLARELASSEMAGEADQPSRSSLRSKHDDAIGQSLTETGSLLGTVAYMSFEQLQGLPADERSDQYSFCASLYEALHGVRPYDGVTPAGLLTAMYGNARRPLPPGVKVPRRLSRALWRGLSPDAQRRWPSMEALIAELEAVSRARWSRSVVIALGVGLSIGAAGAFTQAAHDPCPDVASALEDTWDAEARGSVEQAFAAHGPPDTSIVLRRVVGQLDAYANAWATMTRSSCRATFVTRRQSEAQLEHRTRCLERRRNRLVATVAALAEAEDPAVLAQATVLPFRLPALTPCLEASLDLRDVVSSSPPHDGRHATLRRTIDQAHTLREAGQISEATSLAELAVTEARTLDDLGLLGEALECLGRLQSERGLLTEARRTLEEAIVTASQAHDDPTAARAWMSVLYAITLQGAHAEAKHYTLAARAAIERTDDDVLHAWLHNNLGILASEQRAFEQARHRFERALELKQDALGAEHVDVGIAWQNLGTMLSNSGDHRGAGEAIARARAIFEATVGQTHPLTTYALSSQCQVERGLGRAERAVELCGRALARLAASPSAPIIESRTRFLMAEALRSAGHEAEAKAMALQAARLIEPEDPEKAASIANWIEAPEPEQGL